jgi:MFS family permease
MNFAAPGTPGPSPRNLSAAGVVRPWAILAALTLGRVAVGYQLQTVATLEQTLTSLFHLSYTEYGVLLGAYMSLGVFAALPLGMLGRWLGDRLITAAGFALMVVGPAICAWGGTTTAIAAGRMVAGVGGVGMIVLQGKIIADWFIGPRFIVATSIAVCGYPIGVDLVQLALTHMPPEFGWRAGFLTGCILPAIALLIFLASFRRSPYVSHAPQSFSLPNGREFMLLIIAGLIWTAYTSGYQGYLFYVAPTLAAHGASAALIGLVVTVATWGQVPATLFGGGLAGRFGPLLILVVGTLGLTIGTGGTALAAAPLLWAVFVGIIGSIHPGVIIAVGTMSARREHRAVGMGVFYSLYYLGGAVLPPLCGQAADLYHGPAGGLLAAAVIAALSIPLYFLHRRVARIEVVPSPVGAR